MLPSLLHASYNLRQSLNDASVLIMCLDSLVISLYKTAAASMQAGGEYTRGSRNEGPFANRAGLIITGEYDCP